MPDWAALWQFRPVTDGQEVFGLQVVDTPGHTPGHIAVFDTDSQVLVAGDALTNTIDGLEGPMPEFTDDMPTAEESIRKLAAMEPRVILLGHGPPIQRDAAAQLRRLIHNEPTKGANVLTALNSADERRRRTVLGASTRRRPLPLLVDNRTHGVRVAVAAADQPARGAVDRALPAVVVRGVRAAPSTARCRRRTAAGARATWPRCNSGRGRSPRRPRSPSARATGCWGGRHWRTTRSGQPPCRHTPRRWTPRRRPEPARGQEARGREWAVAAARDSRFMFFHELLIPM